MDTQRGLSPRKRGWNPGPPCPEEAPLVPTAGRGSPLPGVAARGGKQPRLAGNCGAWRRDSGGFGPTVSLLAAYLGIAILAIYLWKTILAVKHRIYQVNLHRISEAIKHCMKENSELVGEISRGTAYGTPASEVGHCSVYPLDLEDPGPACPGLRELLLEEKLPGEDVLSVLLSDR
ncbi:hypothetical protein CB1_002805005 [Camelus ferus]|nr:hypothetical protein CB1_002805005 [Camelus ferus]